MIGQPLEKARGDRLHHLAAQQAPLEARDVQPIAGGRDAHVEQPALLIDVREVHEYQICKIPYAKLIPLGELPKRLNELDPQKEYVMHCKSGVRSGKATDLLKQSGFTRVRNMKGGILAWSDKVDPSVPKY